MKNQIGLHMGYWWGTEASDDLNRILAVSYTHLACVKLMLNKREMIYYRSIYKNIFDKI